MRLFTGLRAQMLALGLLALIALPWLGASLGRALLGEAAQAQTHNALSVANGVAQFLTGRPELLDPSLDPALQALEEIVVSRARLIEHAVRLDGKSQEWADLMGFADRHQLSKIDPALKDPPDFQSLFAANEEFLYALLIARDKHIVYRDRNGLRLYRSDHLRIELIDAEGSAHHYAISPTKAGWINAHLLKGDPLDGLPDRPEIRIKGMWKEQGDGFLVELRIPRDMLGPKLEATLSLGDVDEADAENPRVTLLNARHSAQPGKPASPPSAKEKPLDDSRGKALSALLGGFRSFAGQMVIVDKTGRELARLGAPGKDDGMQQTRFWTPWAHRLLPTAPQDANAQALARPVMAAQLTQPQAVWSRDDPLRAPVARAAAPVRHGDSTLGAVWVETPLDGLQRALERSAAGLLGALLSLMAALAIWMGWLGLAFARRVILLRDQLHEALDPDARVLAAPTPARAPDELGDLSRAFTLILVRLDEHNRYLAGLADRLLNHMYAPLASARAALQPLQDEQAAADQNAAQAAAQALQALGPLETLYTALHQSRELDRALAENDDAPFDLTFALSGGVNSLKQRYPEADFSLERPTDPVMVMGVQSAVALMCEKVLENAAQYAEPGSTIRVELARQGGMAVMTTRNLGPALPTQMGDRLFDAMVSVPPEGTQPPADGLWRPGLGLSLARRIASRHHGEIIAQSLDAPSGVLVTIRLPLAPI
ncbi:putative integral membrane sensor signal transduction histidine kinase [Magnetofaba australis IT-1]|uniref:histidine kinase n=1 Tax=Magnetofaba australis IT-1 TaxID=1434232 RepID=A0A1Y2JZE1_9PROT|nr:putative integral membrane sensor signal transduction histidine kinase [Magnetofaba australis IT-1]